MNKNIDTISVKHHEKVFGDAIKQVTALEAENKRLRDALEDIRAKVKEIKYHHSKPLHSHHGNTTSICQEIIDHINYNLKGATDGKRQK